MSEALMVGMAEVKVCRSSQDILIALGLGSCVGICAYDAREGVAGLAHVVLPSSGAMATSLSTPGKYADTAVTLLLDEMRRQGAVLDQIVLALVGGAQLFSGTGIGRGLDVGPRNALAVQMEVDRLRLRVAATDLGGNAGRTIHFQGSGLVRVKTIGRGERPLVDFRQIDAK